VGNLRESNGRKGKQSQARKDREKEPISHFLVQQDADQLPAVGQHQFFKKHDRRSGS
jgi:hypothetical protein